MGSGSLMWEFIATQWEAPLRAILQCVRSNPSVRQVALHYV